MTESRTDEAMEPDLSRLLVQLLQVLLAFFLAPGQQINARHNH